MAEQIISALVKGGEAKPAPPLGPALGQLGLPIPKVIAEINAKTKEFKGMRVPVKVYANPVKKTFRVEVLKPPTSQLLARELGLEKGGSDQKEKVGDAKMEQIVKVAKEKLDVMLSKENLKKAVKEVLGTALSMGLTVEGKDPKEVQKEVDEGKWDSVIK